MNNGDKIRKMTDKELAIEIVSLIYNAFPVILDGEFTYQQMAESYLKWLEEEVSDE